MKEFEVTITETLQKSVIIEAESRDDALRIVDVYKRQVLLCVPLA